MANSKHKRERAGERESYPNIQVSFKASAGVEAYTCQHPGASRSLSSFCPAGRAEAAQTPTQPSPPQSRPIQLSHAWPSQGIHSGCFLFIASSPLTLPLLLLACHSIPTSHFAGCPINHIVFPFSDTLHCISLLPPPCRYYFSWFIELCVYLCCAGLMSHYLQTIVLAIVIPFTLPVGVI